MHSSSDSDEEEPQLCRVKVRAAVPPVEYDIVCMRCEQFAQHMRLHPDLLGKSPGVLLTHADVDTGMQLPL